MTALTDTHKHLHAQFQEAFPSVGGNRPLRLRLLSAVTGHPIETTNGWTEPQYRWTAKRLRDLSEDRTRAETLLLRAAAELAPDPASLDAPEANAFACLSAPTDTRDRALSYLERIGQAGHDGRFAVGDSGNLLLALEPQAKPREVLAEHLKDPTMERLKAFLCPQIPWAKDLPLETRLEFEATVLETWLRVCRVAARIPQEVRENYPSLGWSWFQAAATTRQPRDGRMVTPTLADIIRRLDAVCDNETHFRSPADLKRWIAAGEEIVTRSVAEKTDVSDAALAAFRAAFYSYDSVVTAWETTFGPLGPYSVRERKR